MPLPELDAHSDAKPLGEELSDCAALVVPVSEADKHSDGVALGTLLREIEVLRDAV